MVVHNEFSEQSCCLCGYWTERLRLVQSKLEQAPSTQTRDAYQRLADHYLRMRAYCHRVGSRNPSNDG